MERETGVGERKTGMVEREQKKERYEWEKGDRERERQEWERGNERKDRKRDRGWDRKMRRETGVRER